MEKIMPTVESSTRVRRVRFENDMSVRKKPDLRCITNPETLRDQAEEKRQRDEKEFKTLTSYDKEDYPMPTHFAAPEEAAQEPGPHQTSAWAQGLSGLLKHLETGIQIYGTCPLDNECMPIGAIEGRFLGTYHTSLEAAFSDRKRAVAGA